MRETLLLHFWAGGTPRPQGSKRLVRGRLIESARGLAAWRRTLAMAALAARQQSGRQWPFVGPARVDMIFHLRRPQTAKPDIDKLARAVLDALVEASVLADDAQVCRLMVWKEAVMYSAEQGAMVYLMEA